MDNVAWEEGRWLQAQLEYWQRVTAILEARRQQLDQQLQAARESLRVHQRAVPDWHADHPAPIGACDAAAFVIFRPVRQAWQDTFEYRSAHRSVPSIGCRRRPAGGAWRGAFT